MSSHAAAASVDLVTRYYAAFNRGDWPAMLALLSDDVVHDVNQGAREVGRDAFAKFLSHMQRCYAETLHELVVMSEDGGARCAAEMIVEGRYLATDSGLPEARNQRYRLPVGAFFDIRDGRIARVTTYYNLREWLAQIGA